MNKKRFIAVLLALSLTMACACSKKKDSSDDKGKSKSETTETADESSEAEESSDTSETTESSESSKTSDTSETSDTTAVTSGQPVNATFNASSADTYLDSIKLDGVVLVAEGDQIVYTRASGLSDRDNNIPNTMDTVFELGSITKQFTAVAIMQLVEQGKLSVDDTLDKYIPEYKYAKEITIHQLLNMTSGVPDYLYCGILGFSKDDFKNLSISSFASLESLLSEVAVTKLEHSELVSKISEYDLNFKPGTEHEYSNTNYYFLGMIIEQLSGMPYDEYVRKNILEPLNLSELFPDTDHIDSHGRTDLMLFHFDFPHQDVSLSYSVGVMCGTAKGLLEWEKCVMDRALLTKESWDKILDNSAWGYGYGWFIEDGYLEHSGMTLGYNANVRVDPESRKVMIVLCNIQTLESQPKRPLAEDLCVELWKYFG